MSTRLTFPASAFVLALALALAPASAADPALADPAAADPVLEALVAEALAKSPEIAAAQEEARALSARPDAASALPDPMASVIYTNDDWQPTLGEREMTTLGFMWSQTLPWPGKRGLRATEAARIADVAEQQAERARRGVVASVRRAYAGLLLARETLAVVAER